MGGGEGKVGVGVGREEENPPGEGTGHRSPSDGPGHSTRPKGHHSRISGWLHPNWCTPQVPSNVAVMVLQGCKSTPQKSRPIESGLGRHAVQVANVCSYKLG